MAAITQTKQRQMVTDMIAPISNPMNTWSLSMVWISISVAGATSATAAGSIPAVVGDGVIMIVVGIDVAVGDPLGELVGLPDGPLDGLLDGLLDGAAVGLEEGALDGSIDGDVVG